MLRVTTLYRVEASSLTVAHPTSQRVAHGCRCRRFAAVTTAPNLDAPRLRHSGGAVAALFFVNGATFSNWLPRIPEIRDQLGLGNAGLGATLLGGGLGGIVGALVVGKVFDRLGSRRLLTLAATALSIGMPLIAFAPNAVVLLLLLTTLGVLDVCNDVAMNAQGVIVQQRVGRSIMNRLHAMWSLGFTGGAVVGSAASAAGASVRAQLVTVGVILLITVVAVRRWLIPVDPSPNADAAGATPSKRLSPVTVMMGLAALGAVALEVTPNDWSAVLMRDVFDFGKAAGFGTMACAGAMLIGRLGGDHVLDHIGERRLFTWAMILVGIGALITVTAPVGAVALVGLVAPTAFHLHRAGAGGFSGFRYERLLASLCGWRVEYCAGGVGRVHSPGARCWQDAETVDRKHHSSRFRLHPRVLL